MKVTQEPDFGPRPVGEHGGLLVLALLAFAVGGTSGLVGAVFRLVLERSDRFRGAVIDWAHGKEIAGFSLVIGISAIATGLAAWLVRKFAPGAKGSGIPDVEAVLRDEQPPPLLILIPVKFLGGLFAPMLVLGAQSGLVLGTLFCHWFPYLAERPAAFAVVGMAAFFTAVVRAPVTGIILVTEMTGCFTLLLPMLLACFAAMTVPTLLGDPPIYDSLRRPGVQQGKALHGGR
jgi:H+/Cl- antiporter ClcA